MAGIRHITSIKQIIINKNEVLEETIEHLEEILARPFPGNLQDLRLISIKTSPYMITDIVEKLSENCLLKKISLVDCCISDSHVPPLLKMVEDGRFLLELDLSWSQITPFVLLQVTEFLAENRQLRVVNLSYNPFTSHSKKAEFVREMEYDEILIRE